MTEGEAITATSELPPVNKRIRQALPWWMQTAVLLVVFAAGGVVGGMMASKVIHSRMETYRQQAPIFSEDIVMRLRHRLELSDEQAVDVKAIVERHHSRMIEYRTDGSAKMHTEFDTMVEEIGEVLDEAQAEKWHFIAQHVRQTYLPARVPTDTSQGPQRR